MLGARFRLPILPAILIALALAACAHQQQPTYIIDPQTGQSVPVIAQKQFIQPQFDEQTYRQAEERSRRGLFSSSPAYAQQTYEPPPVSHGSSELFSSSPVNAQLAYAQSVPQTYVLQYRGPEAAPPQQVPSRNGTARYAYASATAAGQPPYTLDSGDKLRIVVFGQQGISNSYMVDAGGTISLPLIGFVPARGFSTQQLSQTIAERLKRGYVRDPHVSVGIETYRPFFILGEVTTPGQYPYVANMTAEMAVAIAGGFAPRADKRRIELTRNVPGQQIHGEVPLGYPLRPGDTLVVKERWF